MSIAPIVLELERQGALTRYVPLRTTRPCRRRLFLGPRTVEKVGYLHSAVNLLLGRGAIESAMMTWALGEHIYDDGDGGPGFLKRLEPPPPEIWEFRITYPGPQARIFGRFAEPDTFVATDMHSRDYLKRKGSVPWHQACRQCAADWMSLFPNHAPFQGTVVADYVTENCDDFPLS